MKKKTILIALCVFLALALIIPIPIRYRDGGSVEYKAILYSVTDYHVAASVYDPKSSTGETYWNDGLRIVILGFEIYNDYHE